MIYIEPEKTKRIFPYRIPGYFTVFVNVLFIPACIFIMKTPFMNPCSADRRSGDCSLGSPFREELFKNFMITLGVLGLLACLYTIINHFRTQKLGPKSRIIITIDSIIGPLHSWWKLQEGEIKFIEINEFRMIQNQQGLSLDIQSESRRMLLQKMRIRSEDFVELYNQIAIGTQRETFENIASENIKFAIIPIEKQILNERHLFAGLNYLAICGGLIYFFENHMKMQIDSAPMFILGALIHLSITFFIARDMFRKDRIKTHNTRIQTTAFICLMVITGFIGLIGYSSAFAFMNQIFDKSEVKEQITHLIRDEGQPEDSINKNGTCYEAAHFEDKEIGFGGSLFCEKSIQNLSVNTKVRVRYREGSFSQRWATEIKLLE